MVRERQSPPLSPTLAGGADRTASPWVREPRPMLKESETDPPFVMVRSEEDIDALDSLVTHIHLYRQNVIRADLIAQIVERCPNLETLQIPPSLEHLARPAVRRELENAHVTLRFDRVRNAEPYDHRPTSPQFSLKKSRLARILQTPQGQRVFATMLENEIPEAELAEKYFLKKHASQRTLAHGVGQPYFLVNERLSRFAAWFGLNEERPCISSKLLAKLARLEDPRKSARAKERYRASFKVGKSCPPDSLPMRFWERWQKIEALRRTKPKEYSRLLKEYPTFATAMEHYYQIGTATHYSGAELGQQLGGVTKERVRQRARSALEILGIVEKKKKNRKKKIR